MKRRSREGNRKADTDSARIKEKIQRCKEWKTNTGNKERQRNTRQ